VIVVDTNLIVYLFVQGTRTGEAESVLTQDRMWVAPWLWRSEYRNCIVGLIRRGDLSLTEGINLVEEAERWMEGREYTVNSSHVVDLAVSSRCSAYDCEFVALAKGLGTSLVTADRQVLKAFPSLAISIDKFIS